MVGQLRRKLCPFDLAVITAVADRQVLVCRITAYTPGNSMFYIVFIGIKKIREVYRLPRIKAMMPLFFP